MGEKKETLVTYKKVMALKMTQAQLKKRFKEQVQDFEYAIYGKCYDCMGFQADGYEDCKMHTCALYPHRLKQPIGRTSKSLASYLTEVKRQIQQE